MTKEDKQYKWGFGGETLSERGRKTVKQGAKRVMSEFVLPPMILVLLSAKVQKEKERDPPSGGGQKRKRNPGLLRTSQGRRSNKSSTQLILENSHKEGETKIHNLFPMHISAYLIFCLFAGLLAFVRMYITGTTELSAFVWNLILAFLPYIFALGYTTWKGKRQYIFLFFWFVFLPNSFYILTDLVHLAKFPEMIYYDIVYISAIAFAGMVSGYASMELIHREWNVHYHKRTAWILMVITVFISMIGVYLGRFLRFNSWDILHSPLNFVRETWILLSSNGKIWNITDSTRLAESHLFEVGAIGLWQFVLLYGSFFLLVYVYIYHTKQK